MAGTKNSWLRPLISNPKPAADEHHAFRRGMSVGWQPKSTGDAQEEVCIWLRWIAVQHGYLASSREYWWALPPSDSCTARVDRKWLIGRGRCRNQCQAESCKEILGHLPLLLTNRSKVRQPCVSPQWTDDRRNGWKRSGVPVSLTSCATGSRRRFPRPHEPDRRSISSTGREDPQNSKRAVSRTSRPASGA